MKKLTVVLITIAIISIIITNKPPYNFCRIKSKSNCDKQIEIYENKQTLKDLNKLMIKGYEIKFSTSTK